MKILFIGGTGKISSACTPRAVQRGDDVFLLNRGQTDRPVPEGVTVLTGDIRDTESAKAATGDHKFDVVVDWIAYTADHIETDIELFRGRTNQLRFKGSSQHWLCHGDPNRWARASAGVFQARVFRGRELRARATASRSERECRARSVPLGKY